MKTNIQLSDFNPNTPAVKPTWTPVESSGKGPSAPPLDADTMSSSDTYPRYPPPSYSQSQHYPVSSTYPDPSRVQPTAGGVGGPPNPRPTVHCTTYMAQTATTLQTGGAYTTLTMPTGPSPYPQTPGSQHVAPLPVVPIVANTQQTTFFGGSSGFGRRNRRRCHTNLLGVGPSGFCQGIHSGIGAHNGIGSSLNGFGARHHGFGAGHHGFGAGHHGFGTGHHGIGARRHGFGAHKRHGRQR